MIVFFDEVHAKSVGIDSYKIKVLFFTLLSVATVAALQTVGAFLVIALVVTPGATAYLITNRFSTLIILSISIGSVTSFCGSYLSYFIDGATGGVIVLLLTIVFFVAFIFKNNGNPMIWKKDKRGLLKDV
jgi:manganese/iron transport system permease protein